MKLPQDRVPMKPSLRELFLLWTCVVGGAPLFADDKEFQPSALNMKVPVITAAKELDAHVGRLVVVRGIISERQNPLHTRGGGRRRR